MLRCPFKDLHELDFRMWSPALVVTHNAAASWSPGLVTPLWTVNMMTAVKFAVLLLTLDFCWGQEYNFIDEFEDDEIEPAVQPSQYGSLWPLPQKVQISQVSFKLTSSGFKIIDSKQSSAGPSCSLLQDAYRRWEAAVLSSWFDSFSFSVCVIRNQSAVLHSSFPSSVSLNRYYEYIFGVAKRQQPNKSWRAGPSELAELQVWITSPDSECDAYPSVTSDESCESLPHWYHNKSWYIHSAASAW